MNAFYFFRKRTAFALTENRTRKYAVIVFVLAVFPILITLGVETIERGTLSGAISWIRMNPLLFFTNALLYCFIMTFVYGVIGTLFPAAGLTSLLLFAVALISHYKSKMIGEPFFPWDVLLNKEGANIIPLVSNRAIFMKVTVVAAAVAAVFLLRLLLPRFRLPPVSRIMLILVSGAALYSVAANTPMTQQLFARAGVSEVIWNQQENYGTNGFGVAFAVNVQHSIVPKPSGYGQSLMAAMAQQITELKQTLAPVTPNTEQPNVIFIMNEAFWDPTLLPNVTFNVDPIPTIRRLQEQSTSGYLLSPQFGGGTSNVEFEALTGLSMSFLPSGSVPYQQHIRQPVPSLASFFEHQGYKSMGIHPYYGWFWNRDNVYKWLGFESFKNMQYFADPEYKGTFISDDEVSRSIIQAVDESDRPMFIYAVTMQNHGTYDDNRYADLTIEAQGDLTADAKNLLETYTQGVHDADRSLQMLIDHFEATGEPTVIVFYGDHLPMLGFDYDVYVQGGFIPSGRTDQWTLQDLQKMRSVPFVVWSNFDLPKEQVPALSTSFLGAYMLDQLGFDVPANFALQLNAAKQYPGLLSGLVIDSEQNVYSAVPEAGLPLMNQYRDLQYDILLGKKYLAQYIDADYLAKTDLPDYNKEFIADPEPFTIAESTDEDEV